MPTARSAIPAPAPKAAAAAPAAGSAGGARGCGKRRRRSPRPGNAAAPAASARGKVEACKPKVLFLLPPGWDALGKELFASPASDALLHGKDEYRPEEIDYFVGFRPPPGFLKTLPQAES